MSSWKRTAATVIFTDPDGRVLIVKPTYKPRWELPGGRVEQEESPGAAAIREIAEELGFACPLGPLLAVDYVPAADLPDALVVVFDGGVLVDADGVRLPRDELSAARFAAVAELDDYLPPLQARRVRAALTARGTGCAVYLEDGRPR